MPPLLERTELALSDYREHIARYPDAEQEIRDYLIQHINGLMCAEIEQIVNALIHDRLERGCSDAATANFLKSFRRGAIRNAKVSEIRNTLGLFGNAYRDSFNRLVEQSVGEAGIDRLGTAVRKRDEVAHKTPPPITFRELEETYQAATALVAAVRQTLLP